MGVCIRQLGGEFFMAAKDKAEAFKVAKPLHGHYVRKGDTDDCLNLGEVLRTWGYEAREDAEGNIVKFSCENEKLGDEHELFKAIAPWVKAGSYLEMSGDYGQWRWIFDGTTCIERWPETKW